MVGESLLPISSPYAPQRAQVTQGTSYQPPSLSPEISRLHAAGPITGAYVTPYVNYHATTVLGGAPPSRPPPLRYTDSSGNPITFPSSYTYSSPPAAISHASHNYHSEHHPAAHHAHVHPHPHSHIHTTPPTRQSTTTSHLSLTQVYGSSARSTSRELAANSNFRDQMREERKVDMAVNKYRRRQAREAREMRSGSHEWARDTDSEREFSHVDGIT